MVALVLGAVVVNGLAREELVEVAADRFGVGAGEQLGGQRDDIAVLEQEVLERDGVGEAVFAGQHQQSRDVAVAFRGGGDGVGAGVGGLGLGVDGGSRDAGARGGGTGRDAGVSRIVDVHVLPTFRAHGTSFVADNAANDARLCGLGVRVWFLVGEHYSQQYFAIFCYRE